MSSSGKFLLQFRLRHGISQTRMAQLVGIAPRRLAHWEKGVDEPDAAVLRRLVELTHKMPSELVASLSASIASCSLPRALSRSASLNLQAYSVPAMRKRPNISEWVGRDLAPVACGVLRSMLDDGPLQRAIMQRDVASVIATTESVLRTGEANVVGLFRTTINYFFHDGTLYSDAIAVPALPGERIGYTPLITDEVGADLFGDRDALVEGLAAGTRRGRGSGRS